MQVEFEVVARPEMTKAAETEVVAGMLERARGMEGTGQLAAAQELYVELLRLVPGHVQALNCLGNLRLATGAVAEARAVLEQAVQWHPAHPPSRVNLGNALFRSGDAAAAREQFEQALRLDPECWRAHAGLCFILGEMGQPALAARHRHKAFRGRSVFVGPYRGARPPIPVLELVSTCGGNIRTDDYLSDQIFQRIIVTPEFFRRGTELPPHRLVINAIGDADGAPAALRRAQTVLAQSAAPVVNPPAAVLGTSRCAIARRLRRIPGVAAPRTVLLDRDRLRGAGAEAALSRLGFHFPILLRSPGFHGGQHFAAVASPGELEGAAAGLPGQKLLAIQYLDARGEDGNHRKYRVMMVGGNLYPLHVAISRQWKVHYFSADMAERPEHRAEEAAFLRDMPAVLGSRVMAALRQIQTTLGLDYAGIDFGLSREGDLLLFECNATMAAVVPGRDPRWDYRRQAVERVHLAVWEMIASRVSAQPGAAA